MNNYRPLMWLSYITCTAVSFFHVYRFFQINIFQNEILAAIAAVSIDVALLAFLKLIHADPDLKHVGLPMISFLGVAAFAANAFDSYFGGQSIKNVINSNFIASFDLAMFFQFLITGLLAPVVMVVSAFVLFAPEVFKSQPKQQYGKPGQAGNNYAGQNVNKPKSEHQQNF